MPQKNDNYLENVNHDDPIVLFKVRDYTTILSGRLHIRKRVENSRWNLDDYCYIHRGDGTVLHIYSFGIEWIHIVDPKYRNIKTDLKIVNLFT